jgi:hypothetical protein
VRKLENAEEKKAIEPTSRLSLSDLPWDTINIIMNFTQPSDYKLFRLNRTFTKLINKRRKALTFKLPEISPTIFFAMLKKNQA